MSMRAAVEGLANTPHLLPLLFPGGACPLDRGVAEAERAEYTYADVC